MEAKMLSFNGVPSLIRANCVKTRTETHKLNSGKSMFCLSSNCQRQTQSKSHQFSNPKTSAPSYRNGFGFTVIMSYSSSSTPKSSAKLYVSGLSFRTTEDSLRNAFQKFGQLVEVNLIMDKRANRPRGFAFLSYETEEEAQKAIEGMHGKFLDGRVIFVEVSKPRSELRPSPDPGSRRY